MSLRRYLSDISKLPKKTKEEEASMMEAYISTKVFDNSGNLITQDITLRNAIVTNNLKLIFKVAKSYNRSGIPFADLISEGNLGLIRGVEKFDTTKNVKLGYYLYKWIRAYILRYIVRNAHLVKLGTTVAQKKLFFNLSKVKAKASALQYDLTDEEIADTLGVKISEVREMDQRLSAPLIRIGHDGTEDNEVNPLNKINSNRIDGYFEENVPDQLFESKEAKISLNKVIDNFVNRLDDREKDIFKSRFLIEDADTFEEIGKRWGSSSNDPLTKQRIQQIDADLKNRFKKYLSHNQISF